MKPTDQLTTLPLAYAAELAFEMCHMRDECSHAAQALMRRCPVDEAALEDCARLDDALAQAHEILQRALRRIQLARARRGNLAS